MSCCVEGDPGDIALGFDGIETALVRRMMESATPFSIAA
jgi:hypothetical protein